MNAWRRPPTPDKQCRATTKGRHRWAEAPSPPHRYRRYAVANGYCSFHRPPEQPAEDDPRQERGRDTSD